MSAIEARTESGSSSFATSPDHGQDAATYLVQIDHAVRDPNLAHDGLGDHFNRLGPHSPNWLAVIEGCDHALGVSTARYYDALDSIGPTQLPVLHQARQTLIDVDPDTSFACTLGRHASCMRPGYGHVSSPSAHQIGPSVGTAQPWFVQAVR